ncbi:hypothetical protein LTR53_011073 [Teratosphaeriaceae sp. CCFEE 6253]|nr:hypothetical protein LTR53_011073 [Teratosphaeriaceae sp. CCFEE 6253]
MPNFGQTPEALLGRNDSKNAATTCKGLTGSGRPCRRALASPKASPISTRRPSGLGGVVAIVHEDGRDAEADFFCWQHKDQAEERVAAEQKQNASRWKGRRSTELFPLKERSSIDTMVQRLGLDALPEKEERTARQKARNPKPPGRTEAQDYATAGAHDDRYECDSPPPARRRPKKSGFWSSLCCMSSIDEEDYVEVVRHRRRTEQTRAQEMVHAPSSPPRPYISKPSEPRRASNSTIPARKPVTQVLPFRPASQQRSSSNSHTTQLLSLIPQHLTPQSTSALLAELIKPISPHDEEGYIYTFWLTPQTRPAPAEETARSLLSPQSARSQNRRRVSDVMTEFSYDGSESHASSGRGAKTIMLKIGRANNVTRRMNEWQRQCGYALNLVRWYPHVASSPPPSPVRQQQQPLYPDLSRPPAQQQQQQRRESEGVRKVQCVKRVERLIHLELQGQQVKRQCAACGKEHREWFEVEASQAGIRGVDACVKRWVGWAERQGGG